MQIMAVCMFVILISDGKKRAKNAQIWWGWVKIVKDSPKKIKMRINLLGKVQNGIRSTPLYRCFQRANFDTPHGHHEFCMRFWPAETDSHAVLHFMELWSDPCPDSSVDFGKVYSPSKSDNVRTDGHG